MFSFIASHYGGIGAPVSALATQLVRTEGIHRITGGGALGDESLPGLLRGEPSSGYAPGPVPGRNLLGLAFNRGVSGPGTRARIALAAYAARELWATLKNDGVSIAGHSGAPSTPAGASASSRRSPRPRSHNSWAWTLPPSDNFFAETLVKDPRRALHGGAGTTAAGASVVRSTIASLLGIHPHVLDGSGLSESDLDLAVWRSPTCS